MKVSITDKFLWDIYNIFEKTDSARNLIFNSYSYPKFANALRNDEDPIFTKYRKDCGRRKFANLIYYLKKNGYIKVKSLKGKQALIITKEGINKALKASFLSQDKKKRKDGKWIMLIFDIPTKNKRPRALLTKHT